MYNILHMYNCIFYIIHIRRKCGCTIRQIITNDEKDLRATKNAEIVISLLLLHLVCISSTTYK